MRKVPALAWGVLIGVAGGVLVALSVLASGAVDLRATTPPGPIERAVAGWALDHARARNAPDMANPEASSPTVLDVGLDHYRENCVRCHGAPGVEPGELAKGLNPPAPALDRPATQRLSDGELFWSIKYGIRMTGMPGFGPTHTDDQIWALTAFVRHLPHLTDAEKAFLRGAGD